MKKYNKRRNVKKGKSKKGYRRYRRRIPRSIGPPTHLFTKLVYTDLGQWSLTPLAASGREWSMSSLFDPDKSGGGSQPTYFDQYAAFFARYLVYGCKVEWTVSASSSTTNLYHPQICMVPYLSTASPLYTTIKGAMQSKYAKYRTIIPGQNVVKIKSYFHLPKLWGASSSQYKDDDYAGTINSSPSLNTYLHLWIQNHDGTATVTVGSQIKLTYYCKFYQTRVLDIS